MEFEKIILCTDAPKGQGLAYYYYRAFCDVIDSDKVVIIDEGDRNYGATVIERGARRIKNKLGLLSKEKCDQILEHSSNSNSLVILFNNSDLEAGDIKKLADVPTIFLANYLSDSPYGIIPSRQKSVLGCIPYFDLIITFATDLIPVLYQLGAKKVERVPFGYCRYTHLEPAKDISVEFANKVFYFGTWSPEIEEWVNHLASFDLVIEGNSWIKASRKGLREIGTKKKPNTDRNMAIMARKAGVVVNFTRAKHGCFHTMKTFELTAAGACVVSNFSREQEEFFSTNRSIAYFNTANEMISHVNYFVSNPKESERIRAQARLDAHAHSYHERARLLLSKILSV